MAKLVTKFRYYKPNASTSMGGYMKYIATRDGVEKCDDTKQFAPATVKQKELIEKILKDYPDSRTMLEYEDYLAKPTRKNATEFLTRAIEDNATTLLHSKTYADYIATRPGAEKIGSHGLFTDDEKEIVLSKVSEELNSYGGNVWTMIISLRREDAARLGFDHASRWRDLIRSHTKEIADAFKIPLPDLKWYGAFHDCGNHPHIHVMIYSNRRDIGYLTKQGVSELRSAFAKGIFADDLQNVYAEQTAIRNELKTNVAELLESILRNVSADTFENQEIENKLLYVAKRLQNTKGKKVYGYLKSAVKAIIDSIVDLLAQDEAIRQLYDLWYEKKFQILEMYSSQMPPKIPLAKNKEFKSIKNEIIKEALSLCNSLPSREQATNQSHINPSAVTLATIRLLKSVIDIFQNKIDDNKNRKKMPQISDRRIHREEEAKRNAEILYD